MYQISTHAWQCAKINVSVMPHLTLSLENDPLYINDICDEAYASLNVATRYNRFSCAVAWSRDIQRTTKSVAGRAGLV